MEEERKSPKFNFGGSAVCLHTNSEGTIWVDSDGVIWKIDFYNGTYQRVVEEQD